jgi:hypothetical protein
MQAYLGQVNQGLEEKDWKVTSNSRSLYLGLLFNREISDH